MGMWFGLGMAKVADILYKGVTAGLGVATLWFGANLAFNITRGISWHYAHDQVCFLAAGSHIDSTAFSVSSLHSAVPSCAPTILAKIHYHEHFFVF
jgi:hypothetical protein